MIPWKNMVPQFQLHQEALLGATNILLCALSMNLRVLFAFVIWKPHLFLVNA